MGNGVCFLIVAFLVSVNNINGSAVQVTGPRYSSDTSKSNNTTPSLSERIVGFTENGFQRFRAGVTSLINNVSNVFNRTQGSQSVILGSKCSSHTNCSDVNDATCDRGMCNCGPNFTVANNSPDRCLRLVRLGEACEEDTQCSKRTVGGICHESRCICSDLYTEEHARCIPKTKLGSNCKVKDDCAQIPFADCNASGVCFCPKPLLDSTHKNACLIMASPGSEPPCQEDIQCEATYGERSHCINNICTCDYSYHPYNAKCLPDLKIGDSCQQPFDCIVSKQREEQNVRICYNDTCVCKPGYMSSVENDHCISGYGYQLHASLAWLMMVFFLPYLF